MEFPQYRKLPDFKRYYKITDDRNFYESYFLNGKKLLNHIAANQFPEMLRIKDMLELHFGYLEMSDDEVLEYFSEASGHDK